MSIDTRKYARGTELKVMYPWGTFIGGKVECTDGKVRALKWIASTADTFFSVPASVKVNGKSVSGFVTFHEAADGTIARFIAYSYGKNASLLPSLLPGGGWPIPDQETAVAS